MKFTTISPVCFVGALLAQGASIDALRSKPVPDNAPAAMAMAETEAPALPGDVFPIYQRVCVQIGYESSSKIVKQVPGVQTWDGCIAWCRITHSCTHVNYHVVNKGCSLVSGVPTYKRATSVFSGPAICNDGANRRQGYDSMSGKVKQFWTANADDCSYQCSIEEKCTHYTYDTYNTQCYLRSGQPRLDKRENHATGIPCHWRNIGSNARNIMDPFKTENMLHCLEMCQGRSDCTHLTYNTGSQMCYIKNGDVLRRRFTNDYTCLNSCRAP